VSVLVCGEALVDLVPSEVDGQTRYVAIPGGSPLNVAVGLARLGVPTGFLGKLSTDAYGETLCGHLSASGVDTRFVVRSPRPTTVARVKVSPGAEPEYVFEIDGTADRFLVAEDLPETLPAGIDAVHFGSYSMALDPTGKTLTGLMEREHRQRAITFDPNVRPALIPRPTSYRAAFARWCSIAHVVKLSEGDFAYLCPDESPDEAANRWLKTGSRLVVLTRGERGATAYARGFRVDVPGETTTVQDTVGAGDAFMAGLLATLFDLDRLTLPTMDLLTQSETERALRFAAKVAAITCARRGADPPSRTDLQRDRG
jgi:fructokinase